MSGFFDNWFARPELLPLAALVVVPIVIHLLFRLRYRRVRWSAMEFLLQSQRKTRRRTQFEQLLLLLLRCLLAAGIVLAVARPIVGEDFAALLDSGPRSEHVVVLDDTLSMGETDAGETAMQRGAQYVVRLADRLAAQPNRHALTVIATSTDAVRFGPEAVDGSKAVDLHRAFDAAEPSWIGKPPERSLEAAAARLAASTAGQRVLHVVGDFRERDFPTQGGALSALKKAAQAGVRIRLVRCSGEGDPPPNLTVESLQVARSPAAVGVPLRFEAVVHNHGTRTETDVRLAVRIDGKPGPTATVARIDAGRTATATFETPFATTGVHELQVELPADALPADNARWWALDVPPTLPILLVDGDEDRRDARLAAVALAPGGAARTGWQPTIRGQDSLRAGGLERYSAIWLFNLAGVTEAESAALQKFVATGGGLVCFVGDNVRPAGYEAFVKAGLSPVTFVAAGAFPRADDEKRPDLKPSNHPTMRALTGDRNPFVDSVRIAKRTIVAEKLADGAEVLLRLRDDAPLFVAGKQGSGRTGVMLTTVGPTWNNWPRNPSYVVLLLELQAWLAGRPGTLDAVVGEPYVRRIDLAVLRRTAAWQAPPLAGRTSPALPLEATVEGGFGRLTTPATTVPGVYRLSLADQAGKATVAPVVVNVDPGEGALTPAPRTRFEEALGSAAFTMVAAAEDAGDETRGFELRDWLPLALAALLLAEQLWARRCSHRTAG